MCNKKSRTPSAFLKNAERTAQTHCNKEMHIVSLMFRGKYVKSVFPSQKRLTEHHKKIKNSKGEWNAVSATETRD